MSHSWWVVVTLVVGACADDVATSEVPLQPLCGADGPVALVELAEDEELGSFWRYGDEGSIVAAVIPIERPPDGEPVQINRHLVVDACGAQLGRARADVQWLTTAQDEIFGCSRDGELLHLATIDDPAATRVTRGSCFFAEVAGVLVGKDVDPDASEVRLVAITVSPDGPHRSELLGGLLADDDPTNEPTIHVVDDRIFAQQVVDGSVHSIDPVTGQVRMELVSAGVFSPQPRAIAYRPTPLEDGQTGPVRVRARESGAEVTIVEDLSADFRLGWYGQNLLVAYARQGEPSRRWFLLDPPHEVVPPAGTAIVSIRDDGLVWLEREHPQDWRVDFLRWREGEEPEIAMECAECFAAWPTDRDAVYVGANTAYPERIEVWRVGDDGAPPVRVAYPVNNDYRVLDDGRILGVDDVSQTSAYGPLLLFDGDGGPGHSIANRVERHAATLTGLYDTPGEIVYEARRDDGTGTLYRARLAPP